MSQTSSTKCGEISNSSIVVLVAVKNIQKEGVSLHMFVTLDVSDNVKYYNIVISGADQSHVCS